MSNFFTVTFFSPLSVSVGQIGPFQTEYFDHLKTQDEGSGRHPSAGALGGIFRVSCRRPKGMFLSKAGSSEHTASCQSSSEASVAQGNSTKPAMMRSSEGGKESSPKPSAVFFFPFSKS